MDDDWKEFMDPNKMAKIEKIVRNILEQLPKMTELNKEELHKETERMREEITNIFSE